MNARTHYQKITSFLIATTVTMTLFSCGSFQGASYFSSDGIYSSAAATKTEYAKKASANNSSYYTEYFKDAAQGNTSSNDLYFTDAEQYNSAYAYEDEDRIIGSSQIPWGENTTQTEIVIIDQSPNFYWGLSGFAFRTSPFWSNYYYRDPFRFGYGGFASPFMNPYVNPYYGYGGSSFGFWGYDPFFYSPFNYYPGYAYGYGWNRWNRWNHNGINHYNNNNRFGTDYSTTVARVKSGRGEKNYGTSRRNEINEKQNVKSNDLDLNEPSLSLVNTGRGIDSFGGGYYLKNRREENVLGSKSRDQSKTARPTFGSIGSADSKGIERSNSTANKGIQNSTQGRFIQSRLSDGNRNNTTQNSSGLQTNRTTRSSNFSRSIRSTDTRSTRSYNNTNSFQSRSSSSSSNSRSVSPPSRSFSSGGSSRSSSSSGGRGSSGGRRNQ